MPSRTNTVFNEDQRELLDALIPEYDAFVVEHNPTHIKRHRGLTCWRKSKATELMKKTPFQKMLTNTSGPDSNEYKDWFEAICRYYINHYNNKYLRNLDDPVTNNIVATNGGQLTTDARDPKNSVKDLLRRAFIVFSSELTARELFAKENKELVKSKMDDISDDFPDLSGGPLRQKALKLLWKDEDQKKWEDRLEALQGDVQANQEEFEFLMFAALEDLCTRKRLGSVMMSFSYAFRDANDGLNNNTIFMGFNAETEEIISATPSTSERDAMLNAWCTFADSHIPRAQRYVPQYTIPVNDNGAPIMPHIDIAKATPEQISVLLHDFLLAVWNSSVFSKTTPSIPWETISGSPESYFDHTMFKLPVPFSNPKDLAMNPMALYSLYNYFSAISATTPFQFSQVPKAAPCVPAPSTTHSESHSHRDDATTPIAQPVTAAGPVTQAPEPSNDLVPLSQTTLPARDDATITPPLPITHANTGNVDDLPAQDDTITTPLATTQNADVVHDHAAGTVEGASGSTKVKGGSKRGRGRPKGLAPTRGSSRGKAKLAGETSMSAAGSSNLKRSLSNSDTGGPAKKRVKPGFEYRDSNNNLVDKFGQRIDEDGNLLPVSD